MTFPDPPGGADVPSPDPHDDETLAGPGAFDVGSPDDVTRATTPDGPAPSRSDDTVVTGHTDPDDGAPSSRKTTAAMPERIGSYEIRSVLGRGGMGVVYRALQHEPIKRDVALKTIGVGLDTGEMLARFEAERQLLARMDHPSIAKVFDAGVTNDGQSFFAMEYVEGFPLREYCDARRLDVDDRLRLFVGICRAVHHAHQKGIIHRDLKPGNILVAEVDGKPLPKVIDFGIAKATEGTDDERARLTQDDQVLGTPAYMSPEQIEGSRDIDTRTDVYALGVILYELLVGALPHPPESYRGWAALGAILDKDPPTLSLRLADLDSTQKTVARARSTDPATLRRKLKGDLDWIVDRAMEKDRTRRYDSANALAEDLERHLALEPVLAGPPTAGYRARKFVRRHKVAVAAATVVSLGLVGGGAAATVGMVKAQRAEQAALEAEAQRAVEAETATQVADFLVELFQAAAPHVAQGEIPTAIDLLDLGAERLRTELAEAPVVRARLFETLADAYIGLGEDADAGALYDEAVETLEAAPGDNRLGLASLLEARARFHSRGGRLTGRPMDDVERARALVEEAAEPGDPRWTASLSFTVNEYRRDALFAQADSVLARGVDLARASLSPDDPALADVLLQAAWFDPGWRGADPEDHRPGEALYDEARSILERSGAPEEKLLDVLNDRVVRYSSVGRDEEAAAAWDDLLPALEAVGTEPEALAAQYNTAAMTYGDAGRVDDAIAAFERALEIRREAFGAMDPGLESIYFNYNVYLHDWEMWEELARIQEDFVRVEENSLPPGHEIRLVNQWELAEVWERLGRLDDARDLLRTRVEEAAVMLQREDADGTRASFRRTVIEYTDFLLEHGPEEDVDAAKELFRDDARTHADVLHGLGNALSDHGRQQEARTTWLESLSVRERVLGPDHPDVARVVYNLALRDWSDGRLDDAERGIRHAVDIFSEAYGPDAVQLEPLLQPLADLYWDMERWDDAEAVHRRLQVVLSARFAPDHWRVGNVWGNLGFVALRRGAPQEARRSFSRAREIHNSVESARDVAWADFGLAQVDWLQDRAETALELMAGVESTWDEWEEARDEPMPAQRAAALHLQALWLAELERSDEAEAAFRRADELMGSARGNAPNRFWRWGPVPSRHAALLDDLADFLEAVGRPEEARRTRQRATELASGS